jgi:hypothetical protein
MAKRRGPGGQELPDGISYDRIKKRYRVHGKHGGKTLQAAKQKKRDMEREAKGVRSYRLAPYFSHWEARKARTGRRNVKKERRALEIHIEPTLGRKHLPDIEPSELLDLYWKLYDGGLAAKTIRNIHGALSSVFTLAKFEKRVDINPCKQIPGDEMPQVGDNPWEKYEPEEVVVLLTDERIRLDRRVLYALLFWFAAREGEGCGFTFADYNRTLTPLGSMLIDKQYAGDPLKGSRDDYIATRLFPVHPDAAALLARWKLHGFASIFGRSPRDSDPIVPNPADMRARKPNAVYKALIQDEQRVGIEHKKGRATHGFRKAFVSLACDDDAGGKADEAVIKALTHNGKSRDAFEQYKRLSWETFCKAVLCAQLPDTAQVIAFGGRHA